MKLAAGFLGICASLCALGGSAHSTGVLIHLTPINTNFQLLRKFTFFSNSQPLTCKITLMGVTSSGTDKQNAGLITGVSAAGAAASMSCSPHFPIQ